jgi:hypothetical protein
MKLDNGYRPTNVKFFKNSLKYNFYYYYFKKLHASKIITLFSIFGLIHLADKKYKLKQKFIFSPLDEIINSREVKGAGIDLLENLFKDKRIKMEVLVALKGVIKEREFEDEFKIFIKAWFLKVIKEKDFLTQVKISLVEVLKSKPVLEETSNLLKYTADHNETKETVVRVFKGLFLSDDVFNKFCFLFEKCTIKSIQSKRGQAGAFKFSDDILAEGDFKYRLYTKALNILNMFANGQDNYNLINSNDVNKKL